MTKIQWFPNFDPPNISKSAESVTATVSGKYVGRPATAGPASQRLGQEPKNLDFPEVRTGACIRPTGSRIGHHPKGVHNRYRLRSATQHVSPPEGAGFGPPPTTRDTPEAQCPYGINMNGGSYPSVIQFLNICYWEISQGSNRG